MDRIRVHALEGSMVSTKAGAMKLLDVYREDSADCSVFVLSPVKNQELNLRMLLSAAAGKDERLWSRLERSQAGWIELAETLLEGSDSEVMAKINDSFSDIEDILKAVWLLEDGSGAAGSHLDILTSEFLSLILSAFFRKEGIETACLTPSEAISGEFNPANGAIFISGELILAETDVDAAGRERDEGESEYTAALIAARFSCPLTYWNQRSLLCSASKRDVPSAHVIDSLTYSEATELSFFGAPIVHPHYFLPAEAKNLPVSLRYWGDINEKGTLISSVADTKKKGSVKAFSVVRNVALINVEGSGMSGVPGISSRLFTALRNEGISVIFISQASSEYSICFAVPQNQSTAVYRILRQEFQKEISNRSISSIDTESDLSILAAVGENMPGRIGVAGKFFSSLARAGVNIRAIAQGSSERNISAVIASKDSTKALRALHSVFFMSQQTLSIGLFGPGNIGGTLLNQIAEESERLKHDFDLDLRVRGIATSKKMLLSEEGVDLSKWRELLDKYGVVYNETVFLNHIKASYFPHWAIVDCTSSEDRAFQYKSLIESGFHIITPNKKAGSGPYSYYEELFDASYRTGKKFLYETTVGAGLPIISTLKDLRETGDKIEKIEGMVSGTLAWLFAKYDASIPFSELVKEARSLGYTEPDPRDDLSGMDVARKTVILARECGYSVEVQDLEVESLVPMQLRSASRDEFLDRLTEMDEKMEKMYKSAKERGMCLRYVGKVDGGVCSVSLSEYPADHPFSQANGTDNVIAFTTYRYHKQPLVIKGPGAGPEVTAAGVFGDILRLSAYLGSKI